jgi:hypothetical protein
MNKIYILSILFFTGLGCSKDFLERYENRVQGTWQLVDVDRRGFGGSLSHLPFIDGQFTFSEGGQLVYLNSAGAIYKGNWDIRREWRRGNCDTDSDGDTRCDDQQVKTLFVTAVDFSSQDVKSEYFNEMVFTGTNRFKAFVHSGLHTYVFHFRR